jgi:Histidine kinase
MLKSLGRFLILLHPLGWAIFMVGPFLVLPTELINQIEPFYFFIAQASDVVLIGFFYLNLYFLTPQLLLRRRVIPFIISLCSFLGLTLFVKWVVYQTVLRQQVALFMAKSEPNPSIFTKFFFNSTFIPLPDLVSGITLFLLIALVSSLIALVTERRRVQDERQQAVLEKVTAELTVLKLQISPHFLFNTLNNISWLARQRSDKTEAAIIELSQLLRYVIYQTSRDTVPLAQEADHLQHYINLQKMRLGSQTSVSFMRSGNLGQYMIEPMLFIPFVENAFKHGVHGQLASQIRFEIGVVGQTLDFRAENPIFATPPSLMPETEPGEWGFGIPNVEKRLQLHYPNHHQLRVCTDDGWYRVHLTIQLSGK